MKNLSQQEAPTNSKSKSNTTVPPRLIYRKSDSGSKKVPKLSRTLKRRPVFKDFEQSDIKYLWAAYKLGKTALPEGIPATEFENYILQVMGNEYEFGWVFGNHLGFVFGSVAGPLVLIRDMTWLKASPREKIEHMVNFFNILRKEMKFIFYSTDKDKDFYVHVAKHGIIRRIGQLNDLGETLTLWESRCQAQ